MRYEVGDDGVRAMREARPRQCRRLVSRRVLHRRQPVRLLVGVRQTLARRALCAGDRDRGTVWRWPQPHPPRRLHVVRDGGSEGREQ